MTTTSTAVAAGAPNWKLDFVYDAWSRRVMKRISRRNAGGTAWVLEEEMRFIYEGWNLLAEVSTLKPGSATARAVQPVRSYLWGEDLSGTETGAGGVRGLLMVRQHAAAVGESWTGWQVPCLDGNGNVLAYLDGDDGEVMSRYEYDPFGRTVVAESVARYSKTGTAAGRRVAVEAPPFRFSTKYQDRETGLVCYGFRYYAPEWGRWLSRDPIGESGGINLYGIVGNDAVNGVDYLGLANCSKYLGLITTLNAQIKANQQAANNLAKKIKERLSEFRENPGNLPMRPSPGMQPRDSQMGHIPLINQDKASLAARQAMFRTLRQQKAKLWREYNECMTTKAAEKGAKVIGKRIGGAVARKVPWILVISFCATSYNEGLGAAANEAVWPVSELWMEAETYPVDTDQYDGEGGQFYLEDNQKVLDEAERFLNDKQAAFKTIKK